MYTVTIDDAENTILNRAAKFVESGKADVQDKYLRYFDAFLEQATPDEPFRVSTPQCRGTGTVLTAFARKLKGRKAEAALKLARELRY